MPCGVSTNTEDKVAARALPTGPTTITHDVDNSADPKNGRYYDEKPKQNPTPTSWN